MSGAYYSTLAFRHSELETQADRRSSSVKTEFAVLSSSVDYYSPSAPLSVASGQSADFDISRHLTLVPAFRDNKVVLFSIYVLCILCILQQQAKLLLINFTDTECSFPYFNKGKVYICNLDSTFLLIKQHENKLSGK